MDKSALSSLEVLSKACQFVAKQDQQTDVPAKDQSSSHGDSGVRQKKISSKVPFINKTSDKGRKGELKRPENLAQERLSEQANISKHSEKVRNGKERNSSSEERTNPPPPYTHSVDVGYKRNKITTSNEYLNKEVKGEDITMRKRSKEGREILPAYSVASSSTTKLKEDPEKRLQHPYLHYAEMLAQQQAAATERRSQELSHSQEAMEQANAAALAMRAPIPQLPENFQRLMYPGINPLAFAPRELALPSSYAALQQEQLTAPLLQAQLSSYAAAANLDQNKRFYESLQALQPQASAQYLNSLMLPTLQDPKAAASLYQRAANPGIVFPVPGYWLPGGFSYSGEMAGTAGAKLSDMAGGFMSCGLLRNESPQSMSDSRMIASPHRQQSTVKTEDVEKPIRSPFQPFAGHRSHVEHGRPRPESSPNTKHRVNDERSPAPESRPTQVSELRFGHADHQKVDNTRRYDLSNPDHRGNGFNKFPPNPKHTKTRKVDSPAAHLAAAKSPIIEHLKDKSARSMSPSTEKNSTDRPESGASPGFLNKFPIHAENRLTSAQIQAFHAQQLLAQQIALGQMGTMPHEFLTAGHFNQLSQLVPRPNLSPNIRQHTVGQPQVERYSLKESSHANGVSENRRSPAISKPNKIRLSSPHAEGDRYGGLEPLLPAGYFHSPAHSAKNDRRSASPRHFTGAHRENGVDGKRRSDTFDERSNPPSYPADFRAASNLDPPNVKRKKISQEAAASSIEEHFRRSLGKNYPDVDQEKKLNITGSSVDDHFSKSLGDMWKNYQPRSHSASPDALKRRNDYPPPFIKSSLTEGRKPYANGNPPPAYGEQAALEAKHKRPVEASKQT